MVPHSIFSLILARARKMRAKKPVFAPRSLDFGAHLAVLI